MKTKNVIFKIFVILLFILCFSFSSVRADSGFDVGYSDSGSSSSSGGGSDGFSSSRGGHHNYPIWYSCLILGFWCTFSILALTAISNSKGKPNKNDMKKKNEFKMIDSSAVRKLLPDFNAKNFIDSRYADFVVIQKAWMNFDYNILRNKLTDELYNQYVFQLDTLKIKRNQNIMRNFKFIDGCVRDISKHNNTLVAEVELKVSFIDYIEHEGIPIRGSNKNDVIITYIMTFVRSTRILVDKCPNCGADIKNTSSQMCPYCRTIITRTGDVWVLAKKENIKQR